MLVHQRVYTLLEQLSSTPHASPELNFKRLDSRRIHSFENSRPFTRWFCLFFGWFPQSNLHHGEVRGSHLHMQCPFLSDPRLAAARAPCDLLHRRHDNWRNTLDVTHKNPSTLLSKFEQQDPKQSHDLTQSFWIQNSREFLSYGCPFPTDSLIIR